VEISERPSRFFSGAANIVICCWKLGLKLLVRDGVPDVGGHLIGQMHAISSALGHLAQALVDQGIPSPE
jgi:hypothetical protein